MFYLRLAFNNLKKNRMMYLPFVLTTMFTVMLNVVLQILSKNPALATMEYASALAEMLGFGSKVIVIFTAIFTFYSHSFLIRRRQKELGLYNILGMNKQNLTVLMLIELLFLGVITVASGLVLGVVFSRLMFLVLKRMTGFGSEFVYHFSAESIVNIISLFLVIFVALFLYDAWQVRKAKPIELLHQSQAGEKEPKARWLFSFVGLVSLGIGYWLALSAVSPVQLITRFFIAILFVIVGTYGIFIAASVTLLKWLKKRPKFYYQPNNFISISSMMFRMKQNGAGLATICILCTMTLVTIASTACLYFGQEQTVRNQNQFDNTVNTSLPAQEVEQKIYQVAAEKGVAVEDMQTLRLYSSIIALEAAKGNYQPGNMMEAKKLSAFEVMRLSEYNRLEQQQVTLAENEALIYERAGHYPQKTLQLGNQLFAIKDNISKPRFLPADEISPKELGISSYILIVPDERFTEAFVNEMTQQFFNESQHRSFQEVTTFGFALTGNGNTNTAVIEQLRTELWAYLNSMDTQNYELEVRSLEKDRQDTHIFYGGFFFLGIILGVSFLLATAVIIYYKQVSEGNEDRERFEVMQKVGLSRKEVKQAIRKQILLVFFLPILLAISHLLFAFSATCKMLAMFGLFDQRMMAVISAICVAVFVSIYFLIYTGTSRVYYKLVERELVT